MDTTQQYLRPPHPRRPPAHRSVSLLHRSPKLIKPSPLSAHAEGTSSGSGVSGGSGSSPSSLKPLVGKDSSGESSNADKWFEKSNNNATRSGTGVVDNDPPFFIQHSSSEETPPEPYARRPNLINDNSGSIPIRNGFVGFTGDSSSTEEFRGVIDDLTVQNKKLKRRLKKYEKLHDAHLKDEKLFEVRVHGLPAAKKMELEDMLRKFALGLQEQPNLHGPAASGMYQHIPAFKTHKTGSSHTSTMTDSAYASMSAAASNQGSSAQSGSGFGAGFGAGFGRRGPSRPSATSRHQNIQTYLHDIPEGLLPRDPSAMTEKAKKKLIVRRLEQIFAGKGAAKDGHQHPIQQQEVSQLAARDDRSASEANGQRATAEGRREARIMTRASEKAANPQEVALPTDVVPDATQHLGREQKVTEHDFATDTPPDNKSPEQRPTRPLDLDPHRAQVPGENFKYIRHLGFSPPGADADKSPEDGHGWIYLNLLVNMAQLHTINVTADFVQKALTEYSSRFEMSEDGRKVRWKGGRKLTHTSSDSGEMSPFGMGTSPDGQGSKKRSALHDGTGASRRTRQRLDRENSQQLGGSKFAYTPLFYHRNGDSSDDSTSAEEEDEDEVTESPWPVRAAGNSSGMTSSGIRTTGTTSTKKHKKHDHGPIIFYNNARFCADLSGDHKTEAAMVYNPILYHVATKQPVGVVNASDSASSIEERGPLASANELPEPMDLSDNPIPEAQELDFPHQSPMSSVSGSEKSPNPVTLEVSGIGGVCPADNFAINVQTQHAHIDKIAPATVRHNLPGRYPDRISKILMEAGESRKARSAFHKEILSTRHRELSPSRLPPASCFMDIDGSEDEESEAESEGSILPGSLDGPPPSAAPQLIEMPSWSDESDDGGDEGSGGSDDSDGYESDGSLDLLATAREIDPEAIRAREREYDANMAERLAEEIPAGSSAATAGGGSGFASPASGVDIAEYEAARKARRARQSSTGTRMPTLNRAKTSDSMLVNS